MHSITKNYNFSNIVKNVETFLPKCFEILLKILTNRSFGGAFAHPTSTTLSHHTSVCIEMQFKTGLYIQ